MSWLPEILTVALVIIGLLFMLAGSLGILRLPDFFTRTHAASKVDTLGIIVLLAGLVSYEVGVGHYLNAAKLGIGIVFVALSNPVAAHALARAALRSGAKPWFKGQSRKNAEVGK